RGDPHRVAERAHAWRWLEKPGPQGSQRREEILVRLARGDDLVALDHVALLVLRVSQRRREDKARRDAERHLEGAWLRHRRSLERGGTARTASSIESCPRLATAQERGPGRSCDGRALVALRQPAVNQQSGEQERGGRRSHTKLIAGVVNAAACGALLPAT